MKIRSVNTNSNTSNAINTKCASLTEFTNRVIGNVAVLHLDSERSEACLLLGISSWIKFNDNVKHTIILLSVDQSNKANSLDSTMEILFGIIKQFPYVIRLFPDSICNGQSWCTKYDEKVRVSRAICKICKYVLSFEDVVLG
jgi:hypothetical protein